MPSEPAIPRSIVAGIVAAACALGGCARSTPSSAELTAGGLVPAGEPPARFVSAPGDIPPGKVADGWLASFGEPRLVALVDEAIRANRDLAAAAARVDQAAALARQAGALLWPQIDGVITASSHGRDHVDTGPGGRLGVAMSWELDVWGRLSSQKRAAAERYASVEADTRFAYESLAAQVVKGWFQLIQAVQLEALFRGYSELQDQNVHLIELRRGVGRSSEYDVALARAEADTARDRIEQAQSAREDAARALELLLGRYPRAELDSGAILPAMPAALPLGLPSQLLERRPDLIAATRRVAAAFNQVESAKAARLPSLSITGAAGLVDSEFHDLTLNDLFWNVGANLLAPIFDAGLRKEQVKIETAAQREALALFGSTALVAFRQVETAVAEEGRLGRRAELVSAAAGEQRRAVGFAQQRLDAGTIDQVALIFVQSRALDSEIVEIAVLTERLTNRVDLHLALGGGFAAPPEP